MFRNREEAGRRLAEALGGRDLRDPLVLAMPRGGVVVGAALARGLGAELDVVLSRKLRAPGQPELALGAISENGSLYLDEYGEQIADTLGAYLRDECRCQMREIARR